VIHAQFAGAFHHVEGADEVRVDIGARVLQRVTHPRLRGQVDDHIGLFGQSEGVKALEILQHSLGAGEVRVLQQHLVPSLLDAHVVVIGHPVIADDAETLLQQKLREMEADEPG